MATPLDYVMGLGELGATLGTGAVSGLVGAPYGVYKGITSGKYGTPEGVRIAQQQAADFMARNTYQPRGQVAQEALQGLGGLLSEYKAPPVIPEAMLFGSIPKQAYAAQAERTGMAAERALAPVVTRTMERGGLPAQLLGDLSQGSRRQIFIGQSSPLYKGDNAIKAQRMYKDEVPMLQIKQQTGMERTPSGEWVQEMSDVGSRFKPDVATQLNDYGVRKQKTVFEHPTAFDAYSDLGDVTLMRDGSRVADYTGYYEPSKDMIGISLPRKDVNLDYARDTNLHELQHAIQKREGWAQGGSPEMFMQQKEAELSRDALSWNKELENAAKRYPNEDRGFLESVVINDYINSGVPDWIVSPESRSLASTLAKDQEQFDTANRLVKLYGLDRKTTPFTPDQMYKNLEGEAMSRLVQKRKDMTQDELLNSLAFDYSPTSNQKGLDVRPENLLYLNESGEIRKSLLD